MSFADIVGVALQVIGGLTLLGFAAAVVWIFACTWSRRGGE